MEESLQKALLAAVVQQMPAAIMIAEAPSGRVLLSNQHVPKILRREPRDGDFHDIVNRVLGGEVIDGEDLPLERGDGTLGIARMSASPVYNDAGTMVAAVVTFYDVTHERREQDALALLSDASEAFGETLAYEETLRRIAWASVPKFAEYTFVHLLTSDGSIVRQETAAANQAVLDAVRANWQNRPGNETPVRRVIESGEPLFTPEVRDEDWGYIENGDQRRTLITLGIRSAIMVPIRGANETYGTMSFARTADSRPYTRFDILVAEELARRAAQAIDRSRLYESERRARHDAEEASHAKDEFLAILSHELRTPLTTVIGWADLLKMTYSGGDQDVATAINALRTSAGMQARLIDDLLDVSRIVAGKLTIDKRRIDVDAVVRTAAEALRINAETKGLTLTVRDGKTITMQADPARVQQIVTNLVTNAIKFTPPGGRVDVCLERRDGEVDVIVSDTGIGIAPDFLPHVFERFRQASAGDSRHYTGLGLGLSIVQHVVQLHGGRVRAESAGLGKGARFTVTLPVEPPEASSRSSSPA